MIVIPTILINLLLTGFLLLETTLLVRTIVDMIDEHKREKLNAAWEAERRQLEKERAIREVEYHESRMKELDNR